MVRGGSFETCSDFRVDCIRLGRVRPTWWGPRSWGTGAGRSGRARRRARGVSPEQQAAAAKQDELEKNTPQIAFDAVSLPLQPGPENTIGETEGVALNSQKHLFVYSRTGNAGPARGATAAKLFEFDQN